MVENLLLNSKMTIKEIAYRMGYTEWHLVETQNAGHSHAQHSYHLREFTRVSLLNKYQLDCYGLSNLFFGVLEIGLFLNL